MSGFTFFPACYGCCFFLFADYLCGMMENMLSLLTAVTLSTLQFQSTIFSLLPFGCFCPHNTSSIPFLLFLPPQINTLYIQYIYIHNNIIVIHFNFILKINFQRSDNIGKICKRSTIHVCPDYNPLLALVFCKKRSSLSAFLTLFHIFMCTYSFHWINICLFFLTTSLLSRLAVLMLCVPPRHQDIYKTLFPLTYSEVEYWLKIYPNVYAHKAS